MNAFGFLRSVALRHPVYYALAATSWLLLVFIPLVSALVLGSAVNAIAAGVTQKAVWLTLLFIAMEAARIGFIYLGVTYDVTHRTYVSGEVRAGLLSQLVGRPRRRKARLGAGEVLSRSRDDVKELEDTVSDAVDVVAYSIFVIGVLVRLWLFTPLIACAAVVLMAAVTGTSLLLGSRLEVVRGRVREASGHAEGLLADALAATESLQLHVAADRMAERISRLQEKRADSAVADRTWSSLSSTVGMYGPLIFAGVVLVIAAGNLVPYGGTITIGVLASMLYLSAFLAEAAQFFADYFAQLRYARLSLRRLLEVLDADEVHALSAGEASLGLHGGQSTIIATRRESWVASEPPLRVRDLCLAGTNGHPSLHVSELVADGLVLITGPVGAGKSTLLRALLAIEPGATGTWEVGGQLIADPWLTLRFPLVGYLPADPAIFNVSLRENIVLGRDVDEPTVLAALRVADMEEVMTWPDGLDTVAGPEGERLSGGQRQRIALARAVAGRPVVLVLDGPTSALDSATAEHVWRRLGELPADPSWPVRAVLAVATRPVNGFTRNYTLSDGEMQEVGHDNA